MVNPIRMRTQVNKDSYVSTIFHANKWVTISYKNGKCLGSVDADHMLDAGQNHLVAAKQLSE
jgi:hypothetical protein